MPKIKLQCPENAHGVSVAGVSYTPDKKGVIEVDADHAAPLIGLGFAPVVEDAPVEPPVVNEGDQTPPADAPVIDQVVEDAAAKTTKKAKK